MSSCRRSLAQSRGGSPLKQLVETFFGSSRGAGRGPPPPPSASKLSARPIQPALQADSTRLGRRDANHERDLESRRAQVAALFWDAGWKSVILLVPLLAR